MERLTERKRNKDGTGYSLKPIISKGMVNDEGSKVLTKLADYEDAEEQGLLKRFPCKVGDTVYQVNSLRKYVSSFRIKAITTTDFGFWIEWQILDGIYINLNGFNGEEIGKTVFLTREEAEKALADMGV